MSPDRRPQPPLLYERVGLRCACVTGRKNASPIWCGTARRYAGPARRSRPDPAGRAAGTSLWPRHQLPDRGRGYPFLRAAVPRRCPDRKAAGGALRYRPAAMRSSASANSWSRTRTAPSPALLPGPRGGGQPLPPGERLMLFRRPIWTASPPARSPSPSGRSALADGAGGRDPDYAGRGAGDRGGRHRRRRRSSMPTPAGPRFRRPGRPTGEPGAAEGERNRIAFRLQGRGPSHGAAAARRPDR